MTGGEFINLLFEYFDKKDLVDGELIIVNIFDAINEIKVPEEYRDPDQYNKHRPVPYRPLDC